MGTRTPGRYKDAARYVGLPEGTLRRLVCRAEIPHIRIGPRCVLFDFDELDKWIAERTVQPQKAAR